MPESKAIKDEAINQMRSTLELASKQFEFYARNHLEKRPPDFAKAEANQDWANRCAGAVRDYDENN